jgi:hypothetical protein
VNEESEMHRNFCLRANPHGFFQGELIFHGAERFKIVDTPKPLLGAWSEMLRLVPALPSTPTLVTLASAGGVGGFYVPGYVTVGLDDAKGIAAHIWQTEGAARVRALIERYLARHGRRSTMPERFLEMAVLARIAAHELGHALVDSGAYVAPHDHPEEAADHFAARLDAARGRDVDLGALVFHSIGCTQTHCSHPSPRIRARVYRAGYLAHQNA